MSSSALSPTSSILIVGGGTWGCSTALHLARRGYTNVTVLDPYPIPSPIAAGNDINKIMEHRELKASETDPRSIMFATCTRAALAAWRTDPIFQPYFHETGSIIAGHTPELIEHIQAHEIDPVNHPFTPLTTASDFRATMPPGVLTGSFPGWKGWFSATGGGWIHAQKALVAAYTEAKRLGVRFITGAPEGATESLAFEGGDVIGARTADGVLHRADRTILAAGAGSDRLLDFKKQLRPTAWTLCHIRMTDEEAALYRDLPVLFNIGKGFFMEPDVERHELKICDEHPGYCNFVPWDPPSPPPSSSSCQTEQEEEEKKDGEKEIRSVPFAKHQIPLEAEARARAFLRDTMPHLADRPLVFARICWDADTPDRAFLIDRHPEYASLVVAVGGSGNGAMQMPTIGGFIADVLEGRLQVELKDVVRWRPETAVGRDWRSTQGRFGGPGRVMDFQEVGEDGWTRIGL